MVTTAGSGTAGPNDDEFVLLIVAVLAWPAIAAALYWAWAQGGDWLVRHQILVAGKAHPLLTIPGMGGAGLDVGRLMIAVGLVAVLLAGSVAVVRRSVRASREQRGR